MVSPVRRDAALVAAAIVGSLAIGLAIPRMDASHVEILCGGAAFTALAFQSPGVALGLAVAAMAFVDDEAFGPLSSLRLSEPAPMGITPQIALVAVCCAGIYWNRGNLRIGPFRTVVPIWLFASAVGLVVGHFAGRGTTDMLNTLVAIPAMFLGIAAIYSWIDGSRQRLVRAVTFIGAVVAVRATIAMALWLKDRGVEIQQLGETLVITSQDPTTNWYLVVTLVASVAAQFTGMMRGRPWLRLVLLVAVAICGAALVASLRRSMLIGAVLGLVACVLLLSRRFPTLRGVAILAIGAISVAAAFGGLNSAPASIQSAFVSDRSTGDEYRNLERRNVLRNIQEAPVFGIGMKVEWTEYYSVPRINGKRSNYVHVAMLWHWLHLGILGLAAYVATFWVAARESLRGAETQDPAVRTVSIALFAGIVAILFAELTATFSTADPRFSLALGLAFGVIASAAALAGPHHLAHPTTSYPHE